MHCDFATLLKVILVCSLKSLSENLAPLLVEHGKVENDKRKTGGRNPDPRMAEETMVPNWQELLDPLLDLGSHRSDTPFVSKFFDDYGHC